MCSMRVRRMASAANVAVVCLLVVAAGPDVLSAAQPARDATSERKLADRVSEKRMVETVRRLVGFGPRMYGTPSNADSAAWLAAAFREAGLDVAVRQDPPRAWYQPLSWEVRAASPTPGRPALVLKTTWPASGSPSATGEGALATEPGPGAVCLTSRVPTPDTTGGCVAVLYDGRASASGWPGVLRLRGVWTIPVFAISPTEASLLREGLAARQQLRVSFALEARSGNGPGQTVVATLPGRDRSKYLLFCAHGDSDSGGPGADDNASGVAIVLEVARTLAAAVKSHAIPQPAWDVRFIAWGGEISSTRDYVAGLQNDSSRLQAVINYDQSGFGSSRDALYVEPDDVPANGALIAVVRGVMKDHLGARGFPQHAASVKTQGGTDSYVFQDSRTPGATVFPAVTLYTSAWDRERTITLTTGLPPLNWYAGEKPGTITVDGDSFYHSVGDTPANTTDTEPFNMGWCARVGMLAALRAMNGS